MDDGLRGELSERCLNFSIQCSASLLSPDDISGESGGVHWTREWSTLGNPEATSSWLAQQRPGDLWPSELLLQRRRTAGAAQPESDVPTQREGGTCFCLQSNKYCSFHVTYNPKLIRSPLLCVRLGLWVAPALGKVLWSRLCSALQSLRGRSTSTVFWPLRSASMTWGRRCPSSLR